MKLPLILLLSSTLVSSAPQPNALPRGDPLFGGLISGIASPIIGFKKGLLGLFQGPKPQSSRPAPQRPSYHRPGPPAPSVVYHRPHPAPAVAPAYAPAPAPAPAYAPAPKPEIPILPAPDLSGGAPQAAPAVDSYGSPAAPAVDTYGSPAAPPIVDTYGSPAAPPVVDTYGSPAAPPIAAPVVDTYGSPAAPPVDSYGSPEAAPQSSGDEYGSPAAPVEAAPQTSGDDYGSPAAPPLPKSVPEVAPQVEVAAIVDLKTDLLEKTPEAPEDARSAKSLSSNVPQINIIQVEEVDFKPVNTFPNSQNSPIFQTTGPQTPTNTFPNSQNSPVFQTIGPQTSTNTFPNSQNSPVFQTIGPQIPTNTFSNSPVSQTTGPQTTTNNFPNSQNSPVFQTTGPQNPTNSPQNPTNSFQNSQDVPVFQTTGPQIPINSPQNPTNSFQNSQDVPVFQTTGPQNPTNSFQNPQDVPVFQTIAPQNPTNSFQNPPNVPVFQTTGPQVPTVNQVSFVESDVFQPSVPSTLPPIIVDLTSSNGGSEFQGAPAIAHIPGQAFEPIVEVREPKILIEEVLITGDDDTFEITNDVSSPVLLTTPEPVATTEGPIIIDLVTSDELEEINVQEVPADFVNLRNQPAFVEDNAIVESVTDKDEVEDVFATSAPFAVITEGPIELTAAPVVEITEEAVQQTDAPEETVQKANVPVVEITEEAVIDTETPVVVEVTEQVVEQTSAPVIEITEEAVNPTASTSVEGDVTTVEPQEVTTTRQRVVFRATSSPNLPEGEIELASEIEGSTTEDFAEGGLLLSSAIEGTTTEDIREGVLLLGSAGKFEGTTTEDIREGVLLLGSAGELQRTTTEDFAEGGLLLSSAIEGSTIEDVVDATTIAATTLEARQPKALDSDVEVETGIDTNEISSDEPDTTTRQKVVFQQTTEGLAQPETAGSPVSQLNPHQIVFTTGQPPRKGDFTTAVASDVSTKAPRKPKAQRNKAPKRKGPPKRNGRPHAFHPQAVPHKFIFRLRQRQQRKPAAGSPIAQEEVINLVDGGDTEVLDTVSSGVGDVHPVVEVVLPQDGSEPVLVPLLDREAGVFPTDAAPSFTSQQEERAQKSLPLGDDTDPAFLEASSNAEPNDPVPRDARDHYYQHQYTDNHANWYYFRHGF